MTTCHPSAPDLLVMRTAAFHVHGNLGEHGNPGAVQSRAAHLDRAGLDFHDVDDGLVYLL